MHIKHTIFLRVPCQVKQIFAIKTGELLDSVKKDCHTVIITVQQSLYICYYLLFFRIAIIIPAMPHDPVFR